MSEDRSSKALIAAVDALMEYFDSVQIFVTKEKDENMTIGQTHGKGSIFSRIGQVNIWLSKVENSLVNDEETGIGEEEDNDPPQEQET